MKPLRPVEPSARQAELYALIRACNLATDQMANIHTDSRYAFGLPMTLVRFGNREDSLPCMPNLPKALL